MAKLQPLYCSSFNSSRKHSIGGVLKYRGFIDREVEIYRGNHSPSGRRLEWIKTNLMHILVGGDYCLHCSPPKAVLASNSEIKVPLTIAGEVESRCAFIPRHYQRSCKMRWLPQPRHLNAQASKVGQGSKKHQQISHDANLPPYWYNLGSPQSNGNGACQGWRR